MPLQYINIHCYRIASIFLAVIINKAIKWHSLQPILWYLFCIYKCVARDNIITNPNNWWWRCVKACVSTKTADTFHYITYVPLKFLGSDYNGMNHFSVPDITIEYWCTDAWTHYQNEVSSLIMDDIVPSNWSPRQGERQYGIYVKRCLDLMHICISLYFRYWNRYIPGNAMAAYGITTQRDRSEAA